MKVPYMAHMSMSIPTGNGVVCNLSPPSLHIWFQTGNDCSMLEHRNESNRLITRVNHLKGTKA